MRIKVVIDRLRIEALSDRIVRSNLLRRTAKDDALLLRCVIEALDADAVNRGQCEATRRIQDYSGKVAVQMLKTAHPVPLVSLGKRAWRTAFLRELFQIGR